MSDRNNLREEGFILAYGFSGSHRVWEGVEEQNSSHHSIQEAEKSDTGRGQGKIHSQGNVPQ
jgi:hypothetical protein